MQSQLGDFLLIPFRERKDFARANILLLSLCFLIGELLWQVESSLMVLYTENLYHWTQPELMEFNIYNFALIIAGQFLAFPFLSKVCKIPTALILCMTSISAAGYYGLLASCQR